MADGEDVGAEDRGGDVAPLDDGHRVVLDHLGQPQVDDVLETVEPVEVGVEEGPDRARAGRGRPGPG